MMGIKVLLIASLFFATLPGLMHGAAVREWVESSAKAAETSRAKVAPSEDADKIMLRLVLISSAVFFVYLIGLFRVKKGDSLLSCSRTAYICTASGAYLLGAAGGFIMLI